MFAPLVAGRKGIYKELAAWAAARGHGQLRVDGKLLPTDPWPKIARYRAHDIELPLGALRVQPASEPALRELVTRALDLGKGLKLGDFTVPSVTLYYYLFLALVVVSVVLCHRMELSRIGRAWMAIREDEIAAKAMGINTRNMKLLAFGMGATFGGVSGAMFAPFQGFVSPESFSLMESVMIVAMVVLGGLGHLPGVILGAVLLAALPEALRYVEAGHSRGKVVIAID